MRFIVTIALSVKCFKKFVKFQLSRSQFLDLTRLRILVGYGLEPYAQNRFWCGVILKLRSNILNTFNTVRV